MAAANWRTLKKLDAHIHILPDAVHTANPDADDVWMYADLRQYVQIMRENHIERAVIMPFNDPFLMSMEFTAGAVHRNLAEMKRRYPGRFYAFADIDVRNSRAETVDALCRAIDDHALDASSFTRTIPGWHSTPTIIVRSSRLRRSGAFPSPFIPIRMRRMFCRRPE